MKIFTCTQEQQLHCQTGCVEDTRKKLPIQTQWHFPGTPEWQGRRSNFGLWLLVLGDTHGVWEEHAEMRQNTNYFTSQCVYKEPRTFVRLNYFVERNWWRTKMQEQKENWKTGKLLICWATFHSLSLGWMSIVVYMPVCFCMFACVYLFVHIKKITPSPAPVSCRFSRLDDSKLWW